MEEVAIVGLLVRGGVGKGIGGTASAVVETKSLALFIDVLVASKPMVVVS